MKVKMNIFLGVAVLSAVLGYAHEHGANCSHGHTHGQKQEHRHGHGENCSHDHTQKQKHEHGHEHHDHGKCAADGTT